MMNEKLKAVIWSILIMTSLVTCGNSKESIVERQSSQIEPVFVIYNDVKLIALSSPILHDPVVYSTLNEKMGEGLVKAIQKSLINMTQSETKNPLLEAMDVKGLVESNNEAYDSFKPAYDYLHSIFN